MTTSQYHPCREALAGTFSRSVRPWLARSLALALPLLVAGCPSPDASGKYDRFSDQTADDRLPQDKPDLGGPLVPDTDGDTDTEGLKYPDITGTHLVGVSTIVEPEKPLQFLADVTLDVDAMGNGMISVEFQPLSLDVDSTTEPREEVGEAISIEAEVIGGAFSLVFGETTITGAANPITGADILADITLGGVIRNEDTWCGEALGDVLSPLQVALTGSTFGAVRLADRDERPDDIPIACQ